MRFLFNRLYDILSVLLRIDMFCLRVYLCSVAWDFFSQMFAVNGSFPLKIIITMFRKCRAQNKMMGVYSPVHVLGYALDIYIYIYILYTLMM